MSLEGGGTGRKRPPHSGGKEDHPGSLVPGVASASHVEVSKAGADWPST